MADLVVLALTCDVTRSVMFQLSCYRNDTMYGFMNDPKVNDNHHSLSHAADGHSADSGWRKVNRWIFDQIIHLLNKLDAVKEPNGLSILDNSLAVYNSDCGDGASHDHKNCRSLSGEARVASFRPGGSSSSRRTRRPMASTLRC